MLNLIVNKGPDRGRVYTLPAKKLHLLGRFNRVLSVFVSDQAVSRIHAELTCQKDRWYIRDMQSTNGTFVNGRPVITKILLNHRDQIRIGSTVFAVDIQRKMTPDPFPPRSYRPIPWVSSDPLLSAVSRT